MKIGIVAGSIDRSECDNRLMVRYAEQPTRSSVARAPLLTALAPRLLV